MTVLAIDTATDRAAVALLASGEARVRTLGWRATFTETAPAIAGVLADAGTGWESVAAIAVPSGPGSFTGLRVGAAIAIGLAEARGLPLHAVPTLEAVAEAFSAPDDRAVIADLDARRGRRYVARYAREAAGWRLVEGPLDLEPDRVDRLAGGDPVVGPDRPPRGSTPPPTLAEATARLVAADAARHRLADPGALELVYARPGVGPPP